MLKNTILDLFGKIIDFSKILIGCALVVAPIGAFAQVSLPLELTEDVYNSGNAIANKEGTLAWDAGLRLGDGTWGGFNWDDKYVDIHFTDVPDSICFDHQAQAATTGIYFYVMEGPDVSNLSKIWETEEKKESGVVFALKSTTRYVRLCYSGNFSGWFNNLKITAKYYKFIVNVDESAIKSESVKPYYPISVETPTKECYTFSGWNIDIPTIMPEADVIASGSFSINKETINLKVSDADLGVTLEDYSKTFDCGSDIKIEDPAQKGYTFQGWSPELPEIASDAINGNTYTAQWLHNEYRFVVYTTDDDSTVEVKHYGDEILVADPVRTGYVFKGWDVNVPATMPLADYTIRAKWSLDQYDLILNKGLDFNPKADTVTYDYMERVSVKDLSREGYDFKGWEPPLPEKMPAEDVEATAQWQIQEYRYVVYTTDDDSTVEIKEYNEKLDELEDPVRREGYTFKGWDVEQPTNMPAKDLVIKAIWELNTRSITLKVDDEEYLSQSFKYGTAVNLKGYTDPKKEGYTFVGWNDEIPTTMPDKDIVLDAQFEINEYRVVWVNDPDDMSLNDTIYYNYGAKVGKMSDPEKTGYTFKGWSEEVPETMPARNITFISQWNVNSYSLIFKVDGSVFVKQSYDYNSVIDYSSVSNPKKTGFFFLGWGNDLPVVMPDHDVELTANWSANAYAFIVVYDEADLSLNDTTYYEYQDELPALKTPEKTGYSFRGWDVKVPETMPANDLIITAQWTINEYVLTTLVNCKPTEYRYTYGDAVSIADPSELGYQFKGWQQEVPTTMPGQNVLIVANMELLKYNFITVVDEVRDTTVYEYTGAIETPISPEKDGFTFAGWSGDIPETMPAEDVTISAKWTRNSYNIYFVNDGDTIEQRVYPYEGEISVPVEPSKMGYTFAGWYDANGDEVPETMPAEDLTFEATWDINTYYFVTIVDDDTTDRKYNYGAEIAVPDSPSKTGYTFYKWDKTIPESMPAYNDTIVALWKINSYKVNWVVDEGDTVSVFYEYGANIEKIQDPEKEGYTFEGWNKSIASTMPANDLTYVAEFSINSYRVYVTVDGKTDSTKYAFGESIEVPDNPEKEGFKFEGWSEEFPMTMPAHDVRIEALFARETYEIIAIAESDTFYYEFAYEEKIKNIIAPSVTGKIFDHWEPDIPETMPAYGFYLRAIYKSQGVVLVEKVDGTTIIHSYKYGEKVNVPSDPEKEGYTFVGWTPEYPTVMPDTNVVVEAQFEINSYKFTVIVDDDTTTTVYEYGANVIAPENPVKVGHDFEKWDVEIPETMPAKDVTIKAVFSRNAFDFTVIANNDKSVTSYKYGEEVVAPEEPTREGYTFVGWNAEIPETMPDSNVTVEALWMINRYAVIYIDREDTVAIDTFDYNAKIETVSVGDREGYTFSGWGNVPSTMPANDLTLNAVWTVETYDFIYATTKKTVMVSYSYGDSIKMPPTPSRKGYTFDGWSAEIPATMPAHDVKVNAVWVANTYTVTMNVDGVTKSQTFVYGDSIVLDKQSKYGYVFKGWEEYLPKTMPAHDLTLTAKFKAKGNLIVYSDNGKVYVTGIPENADVLVVDVLGRVIYRGKEREFDFNVGDVFIVKSVGQEKKILVK